MDDSPLLLDLFRIREGVDPDAARLAFARARTGPLVGSGASKAEQVFQLRQQQIPATPLGERCHAALHSLATVGSPGGDLDASVAPRSCNNTAGHLYVPFDMRDRAPLFENGWTFLRRSALALSVLLAGCVTSPEVREQALHVNGLTLKNGTDELIADVTLRVEPTRELVFCNAILARRECSTSFPLRQYQGNPVVVSWRDTHGEHQTEPFVVPAPANLPGTPVVIEIGIWGDGRISATMVPRPR